MANWKGKYKFAEKELAEIYSEWSAKADLVKFMSYNFALRLFSSLNTKDAALSVAIGAVAYHKLTGQSFNFEWHDKLTEICEEGYEAGFCVFDLLSFANCEIA